MSKARKAALYWLPKRKDGRKRGYQCDDDDVRGIYARGYRKAEQGLMKKAKQWFTDNIPSEKVQLLWSDFEQFMAEN